MQAVTSGDRGRRITDSRLSLDYRVSSRFRLGNIVRLCHFGCHLFLDFCMPCHKLCLQCQNFVCVSMQICACSIVFVHVEAEIKLRCHS